MASASLRSQKAWRLYQFVVLWLAVRFAWALLVPGDAWPMPPAHYIAMGIDIALLTAAVGIRTRLFSSVADPRSSASNLLLAVSVISGLGLLGIRFTSDAAWWTGHLRNHGFF